MKLKLATHEFRIALKLYANGESIRDFLAITEIQVPADFGQASAEMKKAYYEQNMETFMRAAFRSFYEESRKTFICDTACHPTQIYIDIDDCGNVEDVNGAEKLQPHHLNVSLV